MRRAVRACAVALVTALLLAITGCGSDDGGRASDSPSGAPSSPPASSPSGGPVDYTLVKLVTVTEADGKVTPGAVPLPDRAAVAAYANRFSNGGMAEQLQAAVAAADVPSGQVVYAAVVFVGCGQPKGLSVTEADGGGLSVVAVGLPDPTQECLAAQTTVALVMASASYT